MPTFHTITRILLLAIGISALQCSADSSEFNNSGTGQGGSLASFAFVGDFLYLLSDNQLKTLSLRQPDRPELVNEQKIDAIAETIFHREGLIYIGTRTGMFVYEIKSDGKPVYLSQFTHATGCDPVIADERYAYVTVHSGLTCRSSALVDVNMLYVLDMRNPSRPFPVAQHPMSKPLGIGLHEKTLFVCEQEYGLRVLDVTDPIRMKSMHFYKNVHALDVIVLPNSLLVLTPKDIIQYTYTPDRGLEQCSTIPVVP